MLRRAFFGLFWFGIFWIALLTIGGGLAGATAPAKTSPAKTRVQPGTRHIPQVGLAEGLDFQERYGTWVLAAAAALALAGTLTQRLPGTKR